MNLFILQSILKLFLFNLKHQKGNFELQYFWRGKDKTTFLILFLTHLLTASYDLMDKNLMQRFIHANTPVYSEIKTKRNCTLQGLIKIQCLFSIGCLAVFHDLKASSWSLEAFRSIFGTSSVLSASARAIMRDAQYGVRSSPSLAIDEALNVSACSYETNAAWGKEIGWMYGSTVEDIMTGLKIHYMGWHSLFCLPEQPAFLGNAPSNGPDSLVQQKRWATGLLEIFATNLCPLLNIHKNIMLRQRMMYIYFNLWGIWSVATFCYALLPAFSLLSGKSFLPGTSEPAFAVAVALFVSTYGFKLWEYLRIDSSIREWWNNQRMWFIQCLSAWIFGVFDVLMKLIGVSETVFVLTPKGSEDEGECNEGDFTFDSSSLFIPPTTVLLINLVAIFSGTVLSMAGKYDILRGKLFTEYFCSVWVVISLLPFVKGLLRNGKRGIPWSVVIKSAVLALGLCCFWGQN